MVKWLHGKTDFAKKISGVISAKNFTNPSFHLMFIFPPNLHTPE
jgi:hypothetical protein